MPQTLRLTNVAAPVTPIDETSQWDQREQNVVCALSPTPQGSPATSSDTETSITTTWDVLLGTFVSPPLASSGTLASNSAYRYCFAMQQSAGTSEFDRIQVTIYSGNGQTLRGIASNGLGVALPDTLQGISVGNVQTSTAIAYQAGDRVVVRVGFRPQAAGDASPHVGTLSRGGTGSDLAFQVTDMDRPGWVELPDSLVFGTDASEVDGTASAALGALTAQALGTVTAEVITGTAQAQLGALSASAGGDRFTTGTAQAVLGGLVATADGTVTAEVVTGAATALLGALLAAANAAGSSSGTAQAVLGALTATVLGEVTAEVVPGTASAQLGSLTATAIGSGLVPTITGTAQAQLGGLTAQALADVLVPALAAAQLGALLASTSGRRTRHGLAQAVLGPLVAAAVVTPPVTYAEMRPAVRHGPELVGATRSGPTMTAPVAGAVLAGYGRSPYGTSPYGK